MRCRIATTGMMALLLPLGCTPDRTGDTVSFWKQDEAAPKPTEIKDAPAPRILPETHMAAGQMLESRGDLQAAIVQYEKAIDIHSRYTPAYNRLGIVYQKLRRFDDADQIFRRGIEADAKSATLYNNFGYCLLLQERFDDAEHALRSALHINPDFKRARMNLGIALARLKRYDASLGQFSRLLPPDVAHYNLGVICADAGDHAHDAQPSRRCARRWRSIRSAPARPSSSSA